MKAAYIHPTAVVDKTAKIGEGTKIWHFAHVRENAEIGRNCVLGHSVYVGKGVKIGDLVKLENRASIYRGVTIESNVFIGPHVTFTNDPYPRSFNPNWRIVKTLVKEGASIGAASVVVCGVTIGKYAMLGVSSVITKDIPSQALAYGNPAEVKGFVCTCGVSLKKEEDNRKTVSMKCPRCGKKYRMQTENGLEINRI